MVEKPGFRRTAGPIVIVAAGLAAACAGVPEPLGHLPAPGLDEASGLAASGIDPDRLWVLNDGGSPPVLHAIGRDGRSLGTLAIDGADNRDWEDLAAFELDGRAWLLVADVGDNAARRDHLTLYVVEEPARVRPGAHAAAAATIRFRLPDGPRDVEAVAVDAARRQVLVLTKRTLPPELYAVPLTTSGEAGPLTAAYAGAVTSLPAPSPADRRRAPRALDWFWQPTAMDIAPDGTRALVLTYEAVYVYRRAAGESWLEALNGPPARLALRGVRDAEAACLAGDTIFVTAEGRRAPLYGYDVPIL